VAQAWNINGFSEEESEKISDLLAELESARTDTRRDEIACCLAVELENYTGIGAHLLQKALCQGIAPR
jgi:hypothetical protein